MGPAIALRLRQHLTLTPQVQQALKLLPGCRRGIRAGVEGRPLAANPFLEEHPDAPTPAPARRRDGGRRLVRQEPAPGAALSANQDDWGGLNDRRRRYSGTLREQLMISPMGDRSTARARRQCVIDSLDDDGYSSHRSTSSRRSLRRSRRAVATDSAPALAARAEPRPRRRRRAHAR